LITFLSVLFVDLGEGFGTQISRVDFTAGSGYLELPFNEVGIYRRERVREPLQRKPTLHWSKQKLPCFPMEIPIPSYTAESVSPLRRSISMDLHLGISIFALAMMMNRISEQSI